MVRRPLPISPDTLPDSIHPILRRVYAARGIEHPDQLRRELDGLARPNSLGGMAVAVAKLAEVLTGGGRILVVGDFDADGATSSALAVLALRALGAAEADYLVPNRFDYGYGLSPAIVAVAAERKPDLIVTVDNGVASVAGVAAANSAGIPVVVTDHHLPGEQLPDAIAIVNPNLHDDPFPSKAAAGVGVIFYVMSALRAQLRQQGWFARRGIPEPKLAELLDLVALGTVADLVPLDTNNRILVHQGLARIRAGRCRPGIISLLRVAGREPGRAKASDMGFSVGPRLNAAGRLEDMSLGIECLLAESPDHALQLATELDRLNLERREIEDGMREQALAAIQDIQLNAGSLPWGLTLFNHEWHQGVIGLVASRIKERYHRPTIAFAPGDAGQVKGSARSIPGLHIRDALAELDARHPGLLEKFGGHAMAAGMSLRQDSLEAFTTAFDEVVRKHLSPDDLEAVLHTDGAIPPEQLDLELARALEEGGPWGQAFPEPVFEAEVEVLRSRIVGERHWKAMVTPISGHQEFDLIAFGQVERHPQLPNRLRIAYRPEENHFRGTVSLQLRALQMDELA